jgi:hypothetical protein
METPIPYEPIEGKTYSLFGRSNSTLEYYQLIGDIAKSALQKCDNPQKLLQTIQIYSKRKRTLRRIASKEESASLISFLIHLLKTSLVVYTEKVDEHLQGVPLHKFRDRRLRTTREQYHLYMLEIELANQVNIEKFISSDRKIALLPYCLKDFDADCKSARTDFDYQCKYCSKNCYQHYISRLLKKYDIDAYIWMGSGIKKFARKVFMNHQTLSILGIACIPELVSGMRKCQKYDIPAIGIPLDANRCIRWMGDFHKNSVNLDQLELLIGRYKC